MVKFILIVASLLLPVTQIQWIGNKLVRIKQTADRQTGDFYGLTYDSLGRILTSHNFGDAYWEYRYTGNLVIKELINHGKVDSPIDTFKLDDRGLAVQENYNDNGWPNVNEFSYDKDGFLIQTRFLLDGNCIGTAKWIISDGNQIKSSYIDDNNTIRSTVYYSYYMDKLNTLGNENDGIAYRGRDSKNLIKERVEIYNGGDTSVLLYQYQFDDKERVVQKVVHQKNGELKDSLTYIYY